MTDLAQARELCRKNGPKRPIELEFRKVSNYSIVCTCCGQFSIAKIIMGGKPQYEVWFRPKTGLAQQLRRNLPTADDARAWCNSLAAAYKAGTLTLPSPPSPQEIAAQKAALARLGATA